MGKSSMLGFGLGAQDYVHLILSCCGCQLALYYREFGIWYLMGNAIVVWRKCPCNILPHLVEMQLRMRRIEWMQFSCAHASWGAMKEHYSPDGTMRLATLLIRECWYGFRQAGLCLAIYGRGASWDMWEGGELSQASWISTDKHVCNLLWKQGGLYLHISFSSTLGYLRRMQRISCQHDCIKLQASCAGLICVKRL